MYGKSLLDHTASVAESLELAKTQNISMQLYESRIASLQRAVAFFVIFHEMAAAIADFWSFVSFGYLGYRIDRTQSIMRVATTASPVSGADVRHMLIELRVQGRLARMKAGSKTKHDKGMLGYARLLWLLCAAFRSRDRSCKL